MVPSPLTVSCLLIFNAHGLNVFDESTSSMPVLHENCSLVRRSFTDVTLPPLRGYASYKGLDTDGK